MTFTAMLALPAADAVTHSDSSTRLIIAAVLGVAVIIVLIVWSRMHPFLALTLGSAVLAVAAGIPLTDTFKAFTRGLRSTIGDVGVLIAFGAISSSTPAAPTRSSIRSWRARPVRGCPGPWRSSPSSWASRCSSRSASSCSSPWS